MENVALAASPSHDKLKERDDFFSVIPGIEHAGTVPEIRAEDLTKEVFIKEWVNKNRPCLVKGAVKHWPAVHSWGNKEYLKNACDNFRVTVYPHRNFNDGSLNRGEEMPFHDAIDRFFEKRDAVLSMPSEIISEHNRFSGLFKDLPGFTFLPNPPKARQYAGMRMFMYLRAATAWHYHNIDETLMCQVKGEKQVAIFSPRIPGPGSITDFLNDERYMKGEKLSSMLDLKPAIVNVQEGDALYIPPYWHHGVIPADDEVGFTVACCWASPWHILGDFSNYFVRRLYRKAFWPLGKISLAVPFVAGYSMLNHFFYKLKNALKR